MKEVAKMERRRVYFVDGDERRRQKMKDQSQSRRTGDSVELSICSISCCLIVRGSTVQRPAMQLPHLLTSFNFAPSY